jgi:hypothetical protein
LGAPGGIARIVVSRSRTASVSKLSVKDIDTGKVRFVFREFPLETKGCGSLDAGALHRQRRCREYFGAVTLEKTGSSRC